MTNCHDALAGLRSQDAEELREAAWLAGEERCEAAAPLLTELLKSANLGVQEAADGALRKIGGPLTVQSLIPLLSSEDVPARNLSMDILRQVGDEDFPSLLGLLKDQDADIRIFAADILGTSSNPLVVAPLCDALLKDPEVNVRYQAAVSLGIIARPESAACLDKALGDDEWVRFAVIEALTKIKAESSVAALAKALGSPHTSDLVASMIVEALGEMGNMKAVAMLLKRLDDSPAALRNKIVKAVVQILGGRSLSLLSPAERAKLAEYMLAALEDEDEDIQDAAMRGLAGLGRGSEVAGQASALMIRLGAKLDPDMRQERLALVLDCLAGVGPTEEIETALMEGTFLQARVAVAALSRIRSSSGGETAEGLLMRAFPQRDRDLRRHIVTAVADMAGEGAVPFFLEILASDQDGHSIKAALWFLGVKLRLESAGETLFGFLRHPYDDVKEAALEACIGVNGPAMRERFEGLLSSAEPLDRLMAVHALGRMDATGYLERISLALEDPEPMVRKIALEALEPVICSGEGISLAEARLEDENREVRLAVVDLLGKCRCADVTPQLGRALDDEDDWVKVRALEAFGERRDKESASRVAPFMTSPSRLVALKAVEALGLIGGQAAFRALLDLLAEAGDDPDLQAAAEEALERIQSEQEGA